VESCASTYIHFCYMKDRIKL